MVALSSNGINLGNYLFMAIELPRESTDTTQLYDYKASVVISVMRYHIELKVLTL
jgi:hypothetical protein